VIDEAWKRQIERRLEEVERVVSNIPKDPLEAAYRRFREKIQLEKRKPEDEVQRG
jgi:hypothetical protein